MRSITLPKHATAKTYARQVEEAMAGGHYVNPEQGKVAFRVWSADVMTSRINLRDSTRARDEACMQSLILPVFGDVPLEAIQPGDIQAFVSGLVKGGYAAATVRKAYQLVSNVLSAAVNEGVLARSPARGVNLPPMVREEMRFLSPGQIRELAEAIHPRYSALVMTAGYSGLRFGELAALKSGRVDFRDGTLSVVETLGYVAGHLVTGPPKTTAARRTVALPRFLVDVLEQHMGMFPGDDDSVFSSSGGGPIRASNFRRRYWQPAVEASVGALMRFHDLRHSHVAILIDQNTHPKVIAQRLGHTSVRTVLDVYGHLLQGLDRGVADQLETLGDAGVPFLFLPDRANVVTLPVRN
jgi:integrase